MALLNYAPLGLLLAALLASLLTGRTYNPFRVGSPAFVRRREHPFNYWTGVVLLTAMSLFAAWAGWGISHQPS